jgi:diguanylate cyclase (GGDEF)-like protein
MLTFVLLLTALLAPPAERADTTLIRLHGEWKFQVGDHAAWAEPGWDDASWGPIEVPGFWEEGPAPGYDGFAWYRQRVVLPTELDGYPIGVGLGTVGDAYEIYWNGVLLGRNGRFPPSFQESVAPALYFVPPAALAAATDGGHTIAVRVYNAFAYGGIYGDVVAGRYDHLARAIDRSRDLTMIGLACFFLAIAVYHFAFYLRRTSARENLYFALMCLAMAAFAAGYSPSVARVAVPHISLFRLEAIAVLAGSAAFVALLRRLFELQATRLLSGIIAFFLVALPVAMLLPLPYLAPFFVWIEALILVGLFALVIRVAILGVNQEPYRWPLVAGTILLGVGVGWDVMAEWGWVEFVEILPNTLGLSWIGFFGFVIGVGIATAERFAVAEVNARVDPLTGVSRRHVFEEALHREIERLGRSGGSLALVLIDLDRFKEINDTYGHRVGDQVLERVGRLLRYGVRNIDVPARLGGEEFGVLLSDTSLDGATAFANRLRQELSMMEVPVGGESLRITASFGVAVTEEVVASDMLLDMADRLLYRAKNRGRDQVVATSVGPSGFAAGGG